MSPSGLTVLVLAPVVVVRSGSYGAQGEEGEGESRQGPGGCSVATPLQNLPEEVSARDPLKHPP